MNGAYTRFRPHRAIAGYLGQKGSEPNGLCLPWRVLDSRAYTLPRHLADEYAVIGETVYEDGRRFLDFGVTTEIIETITDHRYDPETKRLRIKCQACDLWDGKHVKDCKA